jgi:site-specific recombinase XerD
MEPKATFAELYAAFLQSKKSTGRRQASLAVLEVTRRYWVEFVGGDLPVEQITKEHIEKFLLDVRIQRELKDNSVHLHYRNIRTFLNWCVDNDELTTNPIERVEAPRVEETVPEFLSPDECRAFLDAVKNRGDVLALRDYMICALLIYAFIRLGELVTLAVDDVNPAECRLRVTTHKGHSERYVTIPSDFMQELARWVRRHRLAPREVRTLFCTRDGQPFTAHGIQSLVNRLQREYIPRKLKKYGPHVFRHTGITLMAGANRNLRVLQKAAGHKSIETTEKYLHLTEEAQGEFKKNPLK